ncbi:hypothetical protein WJX73_004041 [Symbiochloris irregularis]|uniref:VASt domain-containing protein n=1 Tax=Symbiochloris irregularis TaxID=706552 RepID=A0AAW1PAC1_9CHLO
MAETSGADAKEVPEPVSADERAGSAPATPTARDAASSAATFPPTEQAESSADGHKGGTLSNIKSLARSSSRKDKGKGAQFGLPDNEEYIDQFSCALKARILLQGQLYIFKHTVAFHCNIFGYVRTRVLPLKDVTAVRKRKLYGLPNAIEITCRGKSEVYTSFINRKEAHATIMECWHNCSDYAKLFGRETGDSLSVAPTEHSRDSTASTSFTRPSLNGSATTSHKPPSPGKEEAVTLKAEAGPLSSSSAEAPAMQQQHHQPQQQTSSSHVPSRLSRSYADTPQKPESATGSAGPGSARSDAGSAPSDVEGGVRWPESAEGLPPVPDTMTSSAQGTLQCSVREALELLFFEGAGWFKEWHEGRGDMNVRLGSWSRVLGQAVGHVRELQFDQPMTGALKGLPMAPKHARCIQTHRLRLFAGGCAVFDSTQMMTGIPMSDSFQVQMRWDLTPAPDNPSCCQIHTYVAVPFSRGSMWKGTIERTTRNAVRETDLNFIAKADERVSSPRRHPAPSSRGSRGSTSLAEALSGSLGGARAGHGGMRRSLSTRRRSVAGRPSQSMRRELSLRNDDTISEVSSRAFSGRQNSRGLDSAGRGSGLQGYRESNAQIEVDSLIAKASSKYRSDFLRILRAGLNAEDAATEGPSPRASPFSMQAGNPSFSAALPAMDSLDRTGTARGRTWVGMPSMGKVLLGCAVLLLIFLQVLILWRLHGSNLLVPQEAGLKAQG